MLERWARCSGLEEGGGTRGLGAAAGVVAAQFRAVEDEMGWICPGLLIPCRGIANTSYPLGLVAFIYIVRYGLGYK